MNKFIKVDISVFFISFGFTKVVFICVIFQDLGTVMIITLKAKPKRSILLSFNKILLQCA